MGILFQINYLIIFLFSDLDNFFFKFVFIVYMLKKCFLITLQRTYGSINIRTENKQENRRPQFLVLTTPTVVIPRAIFY